MGNKISLICNAKYSEIFTFFQQDDENKLTTCVSVVLSRYFRWFGLFMPSLFFPSFDEVNQAEVVCQFTANSISAYSTG